ncbi:hypothetical protein E2320_022856 [Naja naja]|nr:hypothetical protein E2320_022856 [Naja naja]
MKDSGAPDATRFLVVRFECAGGRGRERGARIGPRLLTAAGGENPRLVVTKRLVLGVVRSYAKPGVDFQIPCSTVSSSSF